MVELQAPAKLTVTLRVTGVRPDGYHLIDAEMVSLDFADVLTIDEDGTSVRYRIGGEERSAPEGDLVASALRRIGRVAGVVVDKRIPAGAGLGGGSSDAAAILRWADAQDPNLAASIGADVAFCIKGGRARVRGIGEVLEPLPFSERVYTLLTPPVHASTPVVYKAWDALGGPSGDNGNDLEPAALFAYPELARWRDDLTAATGQQARLAGSGSTWFVEGEFPGSGRVVARTIPAFD
ncbi:MAG: 4-(cytidine 5'-diphospho)-2-C-methyl-D-erythritol kinase [Microthrixaceae bacterium]|nr:4-(cytidine 5'-diphospho)-2-C-methyl-D-erythritol kinase [Microthrixaceae bacterium]